MEYENYITRQFDNQLKTIPRRNLPWVGSYYGAGLSPKILIVGESGYGDGTADKLEEQSHPDYQRECVGEMGIDMNYYETKLWRNTNKLFTDGTKESVERFWRSVGYFNFVERGISTKHDRPKYEEYVEGYNVLLKNISILKPDTIFFLGLEGPKHLLVHDERLAEKDQITEWIGAGKFKIGSTYGRSFTLTVDRLIVNCHAVKHPSKYFSRDLWREHLLNVAPKEMQFLYS